QERHGKEHGREHRVEGQRGEGGEERDRRSPVSPRAVTVAATRAPAAPPANPGCPLASGYGDVDHDGRTHSRPPGHRDRGVSGSYRAGARRIGVPHDYIAERI